MHLKSSHPAYILSVILAAFMAVQSAGGLFIAGLYRDNAWVTSAWLGNDLVTLVAAVPCLVAALAYSKRGSMRARLIWLGTLYYGFYNNMYYLFGSAFNPFFLIYVAVAILSSFALLAGLTETDIREISGAFTSGTPRKLVSGWMFFFAAVLAVIWIGQCLLYVITGRLPQLLSDTGGPTHLVAALDLWLIVPPVSLAAFWLWRGRPWGYLIGAAFLVQGTLTTLVLIVSGPIQSSAGIQGAWDLVPLWGLIGAGCLVSGCLLMAYIQPANSKNRA